MAVNANTEETYKVSTIREDLQDALISISPTDTPFMTAIGRRNIDNTYFEWGVVDLADVDDGNRVAEGESAPGNDAPTNAVRQGSYSQISDKVVEVSDTSNAVNGAGDAQTLAKQIAFKLKELKRDMETMLLSNVPASAGASGTARQTAGLPAWLKTNANRGEGGADGTMSGTGDAGFPNAAATDGTERALTEGLLKTVIAQSWEAGAEPSVVLVGPLAKQRISTFDGNATRFKEAEDSKLNAAVDVYISDFGELQIVPTRFQRARDVFVLDPSYARVGYLKNTSQQKLARTGHAERRLISAEYGLQVDNQAAHGILADIDASLEPVSPT